LKGLGKSIALFKEHPFLYLGREPIKEGIKMVKEKEKKDLGEIYYNSFILNPPNLKPYIPSQHKVQIKERMLLENIC